MAKEKTYGNLMEQKRSLEELRQKTVNISTGSLIFDIFTGGGFSPGIARFMGPPEHGKTLQALTWAKNWLRHYGEKGRVIYFDCEGRLTPKKISLSGIDKEPNFEARFSTFRYNVYDDIAEYLFDITMTNPDELHYFVVFDSLDMLITKADQVKDFSDAAKVGAAQVMTTLLMKKVGPYMADLGHHLHILSQVRANINVNNPNSPKTKISGGNAALHAADIMGEIQKNFGGADGMFIFQNPKAATVKEKGDIIGTYHTIKFTKTMNEKTGSTIRIPIKKGSGIWLEREVVDLSMTFGLLAREGKGAWYVLDKDWEKEINEFVTEKRREDLKKKTIEETGALTKSEIEKALKGIESQLQAVAFTVENRWQGYDNMFSYFERQPEVVAWMSNKLKSTLLASSVAFEEEDGGAEEPAS